MVIAINNDTAITAELRALYIQAYRVVLALSSGALAPEQANTEYRKILKRIESKAQEF